MSLNIELSVVLPVFNGERFIARNINRLTEYLYMTGLSFEVIVVDDGSNDNTYAAASGCTQKCVRLLKHEVNRGKYAALITGMSQASGRCRIFIDSDLPFELESFPYLHSLVVGRGIHVVVGDRTLEESTYREELGVFRLLATRGYSFLIRTLVTGGLFDTQCGLKAFRGDVAEALFPLLQEHGFAGDVELLYIALKYNLEVKRVPVRFNKSDGSTVSIFRHAIPMLARSMQLPAKWKRGDYQSPRLRSITRQNYWDNVVEMPYKKAL